MYDAEMLVAYARRLTVRVAVTRGVCACLE